MAGNLSKIRSHFPVVILRYPFYAAAFFLAVTMVLILGFNRPYSYSDDFGFLSRANDIWSARFIYFFPLGIHNYRPLSEGVVYEIMRPLHNLFGDSALLTIAAIYSGVEAALVFHLFRRLTLSNALAIFFTGFYLLFPWAFGRYSFFAYQSNLFWHNTGWILFLLAGLDREKRSLKIFFGTFFAAYSLNTGFLIPIMAYFLPERSQRARLSNTGVGCLALLPFLLACWPILTNIGAGDEARAFYGRYYHYHPYSANLAEMRIHWSNFFGYIALLFHGLFPVSKSGLSLAYGLLVIPLFGWAYFRSAATSEKVLGGILFASIVAIALVVSIVPEFSRRYSGMLVLLFLSFIAIQTRGFLLENRFAKPALAVLFCIWITLALPIISSQQQKTAARTRNFSQISKQLQWQYSAIAESEKPCVLELGFAPAWLEEYWEGRTYLQDLIFIIARQELRKSSLSVKEIHQNVKPCSVSFVPTVQIP